jgi:hypothetical protein
MSDGGDAPGVRTGLAAHQLSGFELSHAIDLYAKQNSTITSLWTVYAAANFAAVAAGYSMWSSAAGYSMRSRNSGTITLQIISITLLTIGYWCFALGQLTLLTQAIGVNKSLTSEIATYLEREVTESNYHFRKSICYLLSTANPRWVSITIHLIVDICVTLAIWFSALSRNGSTLLESGLISWCGGIRESCWHTRATPLGPRGQLAVSSRVRLAGCAHR